MTSALTFQNTNFDVVERNNQIYLDAYQIGTALGYTDPRTAVRKIFNRNKDEFTNGMTMTVNLTVNGINNSLRSQSTRIFSLRGAHLIAMFARTAVAKQFRKWVLDILDKETQASLPIQPRPIIQQQPDWLTSFRTEWNLSSFNFFNHHIRYIAFDIEPIANRYCACFRFKDELGNLIHVGQRLGDAGYFESSDIEELWVMVIKYCALCNAKAAYF